MNPHYEPFSPGELVLTASFLIVGLLTWFYLSLPR